MTTRRDFLKTMGLASAGLALGTGDMFGIASAASRRNIKDKVKIGVVSNKFDSAVKDLCKKYFGDLVDTAIGQNDDVPKKPAPDGVLKAMKILGSDKNSTIYAGDSDVDIQTAKNAGLKCIGVTWGFRTEDYLKGADFIVDSPDEILKIVRSL